MKNVGIVDIETYFPKLYVSQEDLEDDMGVSKGKFTKGLMQKNMAVGDCSEDIVSMCLTAMHNLIEKSEIDWKDIGRLCVGTESPIDKSKSIKTCLMDIFQENNNTDVLGVDTINACYGGTAALLDSINWIESSRWDGRYALVLTGDIATYEAGPARPTGGAGVNAILIGPDAPIVLGRTVTSYFENAYDFYKPNMLSEYPVVDGKLSNDCYIRALDHCYHLYYCKDGRNITNFDYSIFHAPYGKLVKKSYESLLDKEEDIENVFDKDVRELMFEKSIRPTLRLSEECGNMYTGSIFSALYSVLTGVKDPSGKKILVFSYGSGLSSSMFDFELSDKLEDFDKWKNRNLQKRLDNRVKLTPSEFAKNLDDRENKVYLNDSVLNKHKPIVFDNTYVLKSIDNLHRRKYQKITKPSNTLNKIKPIPSLMNTQKRQFSSLASRIIRFRF